MSLIIPLDPAADLGDIYRERHVELYHELFKMCRLGNSTGQMAWVLQQINYKENKVMEWDSVNPRLKRHMKLKKKNWTRLK